MLYNTAQLTYLEHLGIDVWVPKDIPVVQAVQVDAQQSVQNIQSEPVVSEVTSFSPPSHFEDVPATLETQNAQSAVQPPVPQVQPAQGVAPSPVAPVNAPISAGALNSALTSSIPAPAFPKQIPAESTVTERVEFNIQFWCYNSGIWFVSGDVNVTPQQHKLVHNLAQFLQGKKRRPRHVNVFSWPMIDSPNVDQGKDVASKYLQAHIERLQQACEQKTVIVFNDCEHFPETLPHIKLDINLQTLLNNPTLKPTLWQQLIPHQLRD